MKRGVLSYLTLAGGRSCLVALPLVVVLGCGSDGPDPLTLVPLPAWDGGADAGCVIGRSAVTVQCAPAYRISGDPEACPGFDAGVGASSACEMVCTSRVCNLSGLSDGTSAVVCEADCPAFGAH
jgi:hypothetical protein